MPLRRHGGTLDRVFAETTAMRSCVDSDAEILRADVVPAMRRATRPGAYGSGFLHRGEWLGASHGVAERGRLLRAANVDSVRAAGGGAGRAALAAGASFRAPRVGNEIPQLPRLAQLLALRFRVPGLRAADARRACPGCAGTISASGRTTSTTTPALGCTII